jgi:RNA polymerase sigma-70 factor (ECF subfamily)
MSEGAPEIQALTVEELVSGLDRKSRDEVSDCFTEIIRRFEPLLRRSWRRWAFSTEYPEYAQDVFLSLFRCLPHLRTPKAFPGYFRRVALSVAADHARKSIQLHVRSAAEIENIVSQVDESLFTPIFIRSYLEHLPTREKKVLTLLYLGGHKTNEIAKEMGLTVGAVYAIKARGIKRLREILGSDKKTLNGVGKKY